MILCRITITRNVVDNKKNGINYNDGWTCNSHTFIYIFIYHLSERIYWEDIIINKIMSK